MRNESVHSFLSTMFHLMGVKQISINDPRITAQNTDLSFECIDSCVFPDMADFCTSSRPVCPISGGQSGTNQLVVNGLHGGDHTAHLWDHMDDGHPRASDHGTKLCDNWATSSSSL